MGQNNARFRLAILAGLLIAGLLLSACMTRFPGGSAGAGAEAGAGPEGASAGAGAGAQAGPAGAVAGVAAGVRFTGALADPSTFSIADLLAMDWTTVQANAAAGGEAYSGVRLNSLLDLVGVQPEAQVVEFVSTDGSRVSLPLADVRSCADCLLSVAQGGASVDLIMPGFGAEFWVAGLSEVSVK